MLSDSKKLFAKFLAIKLNGTGDYMCVHNQLKAHAHAYHIYDKEFRKKQKGKIGIALQGIGFYSYDKNDLESDNVGFEFDLGWQAHPIFSKTGDYSKVMKNKVKERSLAQGYNISRLPVFSKFWIDYIKYRNITLFMKYQHKKKRKNLLTSLFQRIS